MVSVPIGGIRVDLELNSAAFIRDIAKSSAATAKATTAIGHSVGGLRSSFEKITKIAAGFLAGDFGLKAIARFEQMTKASLALAETMGGDIGEEAKRAESAVSNLRSAFEFGFAQGFLSNFNKDLLTSQAELDNLTLAGERFGKAWAWSLNTAASGFNLLIEKAGDLIEHMKKASDPELNRILQPNNPEFNPPPAGAPPLPVDNLIQFNAAQKELQDLMKEDPSFWDATTTATKGWTDALRDANSILKDAQTPLEAYQAKILEIQLLQSAGILTNQQAATASMQASASMANTWVAAGAAVTGALANLFEGNKAFAIANAVVNTAEAITAALKNPPGPPFSFVYAAAAAAAGAAQIASILSAKPGSSRTAPSAALKGNKGVTTASASGASGRPSPTQAVTINIVGDVFGPEHFRKIVAGINGVQQDGTALLQVA